MFRASSGILAQKMTTVASTVLLLQQMGILPYNGICKQCDSIIIDDYKKSRRFLYWNCKKCYVKTPLRHNTVLYNSNTKLERFVLLMWNFCEQSKTYNQICNDVCIPSEGYKDDFMSHETINKWNKYFRYICCIDVKINMTEKIGGIDDIVEIDESMFGKMKYGKGNPSN